MIESPEMLIKEVNVEINDATGGRVNEYPQHPLNEKYSISVNSPLSIIKSDTIYGMIRGLETFFQFVYPLGNVIPCPTLIEDYPRFKWRGLLLDTSRHFHPVKTIKKIIDGLNYSKYNVLHWHITDAVSFPLYIPKYPDLANKTSFNGQYYTENDLREIIDYAKLNGIRVVPEIDSPAHIAALYKWDKDIIIDCGEEINFKDFGKANHYIINPLNEKTYQVIQSIYDYIISVFPDKYFHLGGDEVTTDFWTCDDNIKEHLVNEGLSIKYNN